MAESTSSARHLTATKARVQNQVEALSRRPRVAEHFHSPYPNNFVILLIPRRHDLARYLDDLGTATAPLNHADRSLIRYCKKLSRKAPTPCGTSDLIEWESCIKNKTNLIGIKFAMEVAQHLERSGVLPCPFAEHVRAERPNIIQAFVSIPESFQRVTRVNAYLDRPSRDRALGAVLEQVHQHPELALCIDRIEIAKDLEPVASSTVPYPTLIVYLDVAAAGLLDALAQLRGILVRHDPYAPLRTTFAYAWTESSTLTQGYFLYKCYLQLLGVLEAVYDPHSNYAFALETPPALLAATKENPRA